MTKYVQQNPLKGIMLGALAGGLASAVMDDYWAIIATLPSEKKEQEKSKEQGKRPEQQPQTAAEKDKEGEAAKKGESSTQVIADHASQIATGKEVPKANKELAGFGVHYLTGILFGGVFGLLSALRPATGLPMGLLFGGAIWLGLDEVILRALKIAPDPREVPKKQHAQALGAHLVYGATTAFLTKMFLHPKKR